MTTHPSQNSCQNHVVFPGLDLPGIFHGVFSRQGGVSPAPWDSFNVAFGLGDNDANVMANRNFIKTTLGIDILISARQVHGDTIGIVTDRPSTDIEIDGYDALITNVNEIGLMVQHADCQAILLYDPAQKAVGIIHAGWRGSVANIINTTIKTMGKVFAVSPIDIFAGIGPSLGPCCAEFVNYRRELPVSLHKYQNGENLFDFWEVSKDQLCAAGIKPGNIAIAKKCTVCCTDYFSYRRDTITGRCGSVIGLRK